MIRKAILSDIDKALLITKACAREMIHNHIYQWNDAYPNKKAFETDFNRDEFYVLEHNNTVIGCITISTFMDAEYHDVPWLTPNDNNLYVHRLAVHPEHQNKGYANELMQYAETFARKNNFNSVRLDTFSQNQKNLSFYEKRGYKRLSEIYFERQSAYPFYCYELVL
ncbi:GNAT family N-acetyltransferase [Siansivirga zeaxanthinifaciens]|uniref:GNAT family acetyltransferase n=1 Tax=Siansivirga zeaxanthinifaciens CC-SAMT-1 TaxID=1454006 RepID=A0A0C5W7B6_9FLAO|nr:GNAT family N-acetyltransferase [Siansivirga zeaxanthinifaciens]AJR03053.1 GNAT family acetyltransferase [Siansivirga zeaxanthinifaciens CC-SAMT-1]